MALLEKNYIFQQMKHGEILFLILDMSPQKGCILMYPLDNGKAGYTVSYTHLMWHHIFEIWFEDDDTCSIYDIPESDRNEYLSETEIEELRGIIYNLCKDKINL